VSNTLPFLNEITRAIDAGEIPLHMAVQLSDGNLRRVWDRYEHPAAMAELIEAIPAMTVPAIAMVEVALVGVEASGETDAMRWGRGDDQARAYLERARSLLVFRHTTGIDHPGSVQEIRGLYRRAAAITGGRRWDGVRIALLAAGRELDQAQVLVPPVNEAMALTSLINGLVSLAIPEVSKSIYRKIRDLVPPPTLEQVVAAADAVRERWLAARIP